MHFTPVPHSLDKLNHSILCRFANTNVECECMKYLKTFCQLIVLYESLIYSIDLCGTCTCIDL